RKGFATTPRHSSWPGSWARRYVAAAPVSSSRTRATSHGWPATNRRHRGSKAERDAIRPWRASWWQRGGPGWWRGEERAPDWPALPVAQTTGPSVPDRPGQPDGDLGEDNQGDEQDQHRGDEPEHPAH